MTGTIKALSIFSVLVLAPAAFAQSAEIDINGDGMYSYAELRAFAPNLTQATFEILDTSGDALLDAGEIAAGVAAGILPG